MGYFYPDVCWRVIAARDKNEIQFYNVFHHAAFCCEVAKTSMRRISRQQFSEMIKKYAHYYFCCKSEWEIVVSDWLGLEEKIDVYAQLEMNWEQFIDYILKNKKALIKWYKENWIDE